MYQQGDCVVYGIHGVCRIVELEERTVDRKPVTYYVLEPLEQSGARFLVPIHNKIAVSKLRQMLTKEELDLLLRSDRVRETCWVADENQRKQLYRELINGGDRLALLRMIYTLHQHKQEQAAAGRKFHLCDENFLRDAQKMIDSEFSVVLGIQPSEVEAYILSAFE